MYRVVLPLFFLYFISHMEWFDVTSILTYGDWMHQGYHTLTSVFTDSLSLWSQDFLFGGASVDIGMRFPVWILAEMTEIFHMPYPIGERLVWFFPMMIFSIGGSYILFRHIFRPYFLPVLAASLIYNYNVYFLIVQISGHMSIALGYAMMPLFIYLSLRLFESPSWKGAVYVSLSVFLLSLYEPRIAYIGIGIFLILAFLYRLHIRYICGVIALFIGLSAFSFLPILAGGIYFDNTITSQGLFAPYFMSISNSFSLFHTFWSGEKLVFFSMNPIPAFFWIIPIMALAGLIVQIKTPRVRIFAILTIVGIFLTKQSDVPFPAFYKWAYEHIPVFNLFRESSKFYVILTLGYSVLIGYFLLALLEGRKYIFAYISLAVITAYSLLNLMPLITREAGSLFVEREIPQDYLILNKYIEKDPTFSRILSVPFVSRWMDYSSRHPALAASSIKDKHWKNLLASFSSSGVSGGDDSSEVLKKVLSQGSVGYIVLPLQDTKNDDDFYTDTKIDKKKIQSIFTSKPYLHKLDLGFQELTVYAVDESLARSRVGGDSLRFLTFQRINPAIYELDIALSGTSSLELLESFHPGWKISLEPYSPLVCEQQSYSPGLSSQTECLGKSSFFPKRDIDLFSRQFLFDESHKKIYGYANGWILDSTYIKENYPASYYRQNPDGTIHIRMTLYFRPELYFHLGLLISEIILAISLIFIAYPRKDRKKKIAKGDIGI